MEQKRIEWNRVEDNRLEQSRIEWNGMEQNFTCIYQIKRQEKVNYRQNDLEEGDEEANK